MKKIIISLIAFLVIVLIFIGIFANKSNNNEKENLKNITVADTTLTSRTYMN